MIRLKIFLPLFIVLFAYSVMCEDLQEIKRLGWLRARQNYQYNHPPLVETYDVPVIYDKVIDRANRIQKVLTVKSAENSVDESKSKETLSISKNADFYASTTEVFDTESATEYYDFEQSEDMTELPEEFLTIPKYKRRRFKLAKYTYSYEPKSNPVTITYNDEPSYTVRDKVNYGFTKRKDYVKPSFQTIYESKTTSGSESEIEKSTHFENDAYNEDSVSATGFRRRPLIKRLRKHKNPQRFGYQNYKSQISGIEQTEAERNNIELEEKQEVAKQISTMFMKKDEKISDNSNNEDSSLTDRNSQSSKKYLKFNNEWSYSDAEFSLDPLETHTQIGNIQKETKIPRERLETSVKIGLSSKKETSYDRISNDATKNNTTVTRKYFKSPQKYETHRNYDAEVYLTSAKISTSGVQRETQSSINDKQERIKTKSDEAINRKVPNIRKEPLKYIKRLHVLANSNASVSNSNTQTKGVEKETDKIVIENPKNTGQIAKVQSSSENLEQATNFNNASKAIILSSSIETESTQINNDETKVGDDLITDQISNNKYKTRVNNAESVDKTHDSELGAAVKTQVSSKSFLSSTATTNKAKSKTGEIVTTDILDSFETSNIKPSYKVNKSDANSNYKTESSIMSDQSTTPKYLNRPEILTTRRNYDSVVSLVSKNRKESSQSETSEIVGTTKLDYLEKSNKRTSNPKSKSATNSESRSIVKNQASILKSLRRRQMTTTGRNYASRTSLVNMNLENRQNKTVNESLVSNTLSAVQITNRQFSNTRVKSVRGINHEETSSSAAQDQASTKKYFKRPHKIVIRRNNVTSLSPEVTETEGILTKSTDSKVTGELNNIQILNMQTSRKYAESATVSNNETESLSTVKNKKTSSKFFRRPQMFNVRQNNVSRASFNLLDTDTESTIAVTANIASSKGQGVSSKYSSIQISGDAAENNDFSFLNQQTKMNSSFLNTAKNQNVQQTQTQEKNRTLNGRNVFYATSGLKFDENAIYWQSSSSTNTQNRTKTGQVIQKNNIALGKEQINIENSSLTAIVEENDNKNISGNQENIDEIGTKAAGLLNIVNLRATEINKTNTDHFYSKPKLIITRRKYNSGALTSKSNIESNNNNLEVTVQRNEKSLLRKMPEEKITSFEESKSIATDNLRSRVRIRGQETYDNFKVHSIVNNVDSKNQNDQGNIKLTRQYIKKSSTASSADTLKKNIVEIGSQNVLQKNYEQLFYGTKVSSPDASSHSNNASEFQTEDTVIEQMQSKPTVQKNSKTFTTTAKFKINDDISQDPSELRHGNTFTQPQRTNKNISIVPKNVTNDGNVEFKKAISTIESSSNAQFTATSSEQQQNFHHLQHSKFEGSGDMFQISKEHSESTKSEENEEKRSLGAAANESNKRNQEGVRITSNGKKIVETSNMKPIEPSGVNTITKQFTRVIASTSKNQPIEVRKEGIEAVESPLTSTQHQKYETVTTTINNNSEKEGWQIDRKHSRRIISKSITKPVETTRQVFTSYTEPKIKIRERPVEASTFTLTKSKAETFDSGTNMESGSESSAHSFKPTLIIKEVFVEKPVQYSVELTPVKSHHIIKSKAESNSESWTSTGSQSHRFHGDREPIVPIIKQQNRVFSHNGEFIYSYEGGDGTRAFSKGKLKEVKKDHAGEAVEGGFSYTDKDGKDFSMSYTADENGYRPVGAHLPTPPPIPIAIARALAYLATKTTPEPVTESTWKH